MDNYLALVLGVIVAGAGGELFVRGAIGLAEWARIPAGIIGATIAAFATSSPECAVAVSAALAGTPQISLGDALGSNVVNVALILALALLMGSIRAPRDSLKRDFPVAMLVPGLLAVLAFDGMLSRLDGVMLLVVFCTWLTATVLEARRQRSAVEQVLGEPRKGLALVYSLVGLACLIVAGRLIVTSAQGIALSFGLDEFVIGATVVAVGTSIPELAVTVISRLRGHQELGLGTVLGSNIFNGLWIVGVAAIIAPISVHWQELVVGLGFGAMTVALIFPARDGLIGRGRGVLLLALYMVYVATILTRQTSFSRTDRMKPDEPSSAPAMISSLLPSTNLIPLWGPARRAARRDISLSGRRQSTRYCLPMPLPCGDRRSPWAARSSP